MLLRLQIRRWSTLPVHLDEKVNKDLENELYKPKAHPGKCRLTPIEVPERIRSAIRTAVDGKKCHSDGSLELVLIPFYCCFSDKQISQFIDEGEKLDRYLFSRHLPQEQKEIYLAKRDIEKEILQREGVQHVSELGMFWTRLDQ